MLVIKLWEKIVPSPSLHKKYGTQSESKTKRFSFSVCTTTNNTYFATRKCTLKRIHSEWIWFCWRRRQTWRTNKHNKLSQVKLKMHRYIKLSSESVSFDLFALAETRSSLSFPLVQFWGQNRTLSSQFVKRKDIYVESNAIHALKEIDFRQVSVSIFSSYSRFHCD